MKQTKYLIFLVLTLNFLSCSLPIANFVTNQTNDTIWLEYKPNESYGYIFGNEKSLRFRISIDSNFSKSQLRKAVSKKHPINPDSKEYEMVKIKIPARNTTYIGHIYSWMNMGELIAELDLKIIDRKGKRKFKISKDDFIIDKRVTEIIIK